MHFDLCSYLAPVLSVLITLCAYLNAHCVFIPNILYIFLRRCIFFLKKLPVRNLCANLCMCKVISCAYLCPGDNNRFRPDELSTMFNEVEPRGGADVPAVQVYGRGQVPGGAVRGAGAAAARDAAPRAGLPAAALGRRRAAPRALHQPAQRRRALQVLIPHFLPEHRLFYHDIMIYQPPYQSLLSEVVVIS